MPTNDPKAPIRIALTQDQRRQVEGATGRDGLAIELTVEELEERIAPRWRPTTTRRCWPTASVPCRAR